MNAHQPEPTEDPRVRVLRLDALAQGITTGLVAGLGVFVATNWLVLKGGQVVGPNLALLAQFLFGYRVTFLGSVIGFAWAFVYGCAAGYFVSRVYNSIVGRRS
ncbi:MAG: hypothetical protein HY271_14900 [Deltaproteobacteria bacterium]|nr:hypothetical protein [Deltaproteobacteria bacterium]